MESDGELQQDRVAQVGPTRPAPRLAHCDERGLANPESFSPASDAAIARDVEIGLRWTHAVPAGAIGVAVERGWVSLSGSVTRAFQKRAATDSVRYLRGVAGLIDKIEIEIAIELADGVAPEARALRPCTARVPRESVRPDQESP